MCDPATMLFAGGLAAIGAGAGVGIKGQLDAGKAQRQQAEAAAAESERQARLETQRAGIAQIQGEQEAAKRSRALAAELGSIYANFAGNGLLVDGGSATDTLGSVLRTQVTEGTADIMTIRDNAAMNVWTHQANASGLKASAANQRIAGSNALRASRVGALGTGLSALGQAGMASASFGAAGGFEGLGDWFSGKTVGAPPGIDNMGFWSNPTPQQMNTSMLGLT